MITNISVHARLILAALTLCAVTIPATSPQIASAPPGVQRRGTPERASRLRSGWGTTGDVAVLIIAGRPQR